MSDERSSPTLVELEPAPLDTSSLDGAGGQRSVPLRPRVVIVGAGFGGPCASPTASAAPS